MKNLLYATTMSERHQLRDEEGNLVLEKNGKSKIVKELRTVKDNGWYHLSQEYKNRRQIMGKIRDWETYLDDEREENIHQKVRKFKDNEDRTFKKRRKA